MCGDCLEADGRFVLSSNGVDGGDCRSRYREPMLKLDRDRRIVPLRNCHFTLGIAGRYVRSACDDSDE